MVVPTSCNLIFLWGNRASPIPQTILYAQRCTTLVSELVSEPAAAALLPPRRRPTAAPPLLPPEGLN